MKNTLFSLLAATSAAILGSAAVAAPATFTDIGNIGSAGVYDFDTFGSLDVSFGGTDDTEIAIWAEDGTLLAADDDGLGVDLLSLITIDLADGVYFLGINEFDSIFDDNFVVGGSGLESGEESLWVLNVNGLSLFEILVVGNNGSTTEETAFVRFTVGAAPVPLPAALPLFAAGAAGFGLMRRRKKASA